MEGTSAVNPLMPRMEVVDPFWLGATVARIMPQARKMAPQLIWERMLRAALLHNVTAKSRVILRAKLTPPRVHCGVGGRRARK